MGHASTTITERVYARVRHDAVGDRMLAALDPRYTKGATRSRAGKDRTIATVKAIPDPKLPIVYKVDGVERTLTEWAQHSGIPKMTLWSRLDRGLSMAEALTAGKLPGKNGTDLPRFAPTPARASKANSREIPVRGDGIEPPTRGFSIPCSTN